MSIDYALICDECGITIDGNKYSAAMVRKVARREGTAFRHKGYDLCRNCFAEVGRVSGAGDR